MTDCADLFRCPQHPVHIRYEALRAFYHEGLPGREVAARYGYSYGSFKNLCYAFRKNPTHTFFWPQPQPQPPQEPPVDPRPARILALRKQHNASIYQIADLLKEEDLQASTAYIYNVLTAAGHKRLARRPADQRSVRALHAVRADRRALDLAPRSFETGFGGLFLFAFDLARMGMDALLQELPGSALIPAGCAVRSLLALKLWGIGRPSPIMAETLDEGLALFAGLNAIAKRSTLSEYTARCDPHFTGELMHRWYHAATGLGRSLGGGQSFDLDFHTIPYHGDEALMEKHFVSKRSRRQRGILTFLARDAQARVFSYADCTLHKKDHNDAILHFVEYWKARTGHLPTELVFDSRVTTYANLARLQALGIAFITLRRRHEQLIQTIMARPQHEWRRITLKNIGRKYRTPRILEQPIEVRGYNDPLRQIAMDGLGHDRPTLLITNQMEVPAGRLVDRYARRMIIENVIRDAIDFFHMDALSATVPMKIHVDVQLTVMANMLYRLLGLRVGQGFEGAEARSIYRNLVPTMAKVTLTHDEIIVTYPRRSNNPYLMQAKYHHQRLPIPWIGNKILRLQFA